MKFFKFLSENLFRKSFVIIFILTFFLYSFSFRFSFLLYIVPLAFFIAYLFFNRNFKIKLKALIFYFLLISFALLLFAGGLIDFDFLVRVKSAMYLALFFIPMSYIFYCEVDKHDLQTTYKNLLLSYFILGLFIFFLHSNGLINSNRYQHVGNILAGLTILLFGLKSKWYKWIFISIIFFLLLLSGSRQALVGLVFTLMVYLLVSNFKSVMYATIVGLIIFLNWDYIFKKIELFAHEKNIATLIRMTYAIKSNGGASVQVRFDIYKNLIQEINFLPNLSFSPNKDSLLPHNFFLEYFVTSGYLLGSLFFIFIIYLFIQTIYNHKNNVLVYFSIFYFVPFNVSSGLTSAKYFLYYCLLVIIIQSKKVKHESLISKR
ncbi:hypothetical protein [Olleya sp. ITB9]|uniref:hypothetical protein n=1 Tax=Olleya sp. ITB9 TaxID=1715648 RepID=UPI000B0EA3BC|nr:hypothetical protein [Olleya sp. ITB9]